MNKISRNIGFYIAIFVIVMFSSCTNGNDDKTYTIGVSQCSSDAWRTKMNQEIERELLFYPEFEVEFKSADNNSKTQCADIEYFINKGVDILVVCPNEAEEITSATSKAYDAGIPIIIADRKVVGDKYSAFVGCDNYEVGRLMGQYIKNNTTSTKKIKVLRLLGLQGSTPTILRKQGYDDELEGMNQVKSYDLYCDWLENIAYSKTLSFLEEHSDIDVVVAQNDVMAIGAYKAAQQVIPTNSIKFYGVDAIVGENCGVNAIIDGKLDASIAYATAGDIIVKRAEQIINKSGFEKDTLIAPYLVDYGAAKALMAVSKEIDRQLDTIQMLQRHMDQVLANYKLQNVIMYMVIAFTILLVVTVGYVLKLYRDKRQTYDKLVATTQKLENANKSKISFFTNVSHDFRTPLTLIIGPLEQLIKSGQLSSEWNEQLKISLQNSNILLRLINQILDFRKIEENKMLLNISRTNGEECILLWIKQFTPLSYKKHIQLSYEILASDDYKLDMDIEKVERIFFNIMANAFKYTPENGNIWVKVWIQDNNFCFSIKNSGSTINAHQAEKIFEDFYQVDSLNYEGSGLGLALVKSFVELHKGKISVDADAQRNETEFTVMLPVVATENKDEIIKVSSSIDSNQVLTELDSVDDDLYVPTIKEESEVILIIDDNSELRKYIRSILEPDYVIIAAKNGADGIQKAINYVPNLIICDVLMPGISGYDVSKHLKSELNTSHIPLIMLTACSLDEQQIGGFQTGAEAYITKPFKPEILRAQINSIIENRKKIQLSYGESVYTSVISTNDIDGKFLSNLSNAIDKKIDDSELSVEYLAEQLGMSRSQLFRKVKSLTNYSPNEIIRNRRLKKAKQMLSTKQYTVSEVCYLTGFSSPSYFSKCYTDYFGEKPSEMKN